jgi:hypothetical protein
MKIERAEWSKELSGNPRLENERCDAKSVNVRHFFSEAPGLNLLYRLTVLGNKPRGFKLLHKRGGPCPERSRPGDLWLMGVRRQLLFPVNDNYSSRSTTTTSFAIA